MTGILLPFDSTKGLYSRGLPNGWDHRDCLTTWVLGLPALSHSLWIGERSRLVSLRDTRPPWIPKNLWDDWCWEFLLEVPGVSMAESEESWTFGETIDQTRQVQVALRIARSRGIKSVLYAGPLTREYEKMAAFVWGMGWLRSEGDGTRTFQFPWEPGIHNDTDEDDPTD